MFKSILNLIKINSFKFIDNCSYNYKMAYIPNKIIELDNPNGDWEIHSTIKLDEIHYLIDWKIVYNIIDQCIVYTFDIVHSSMDPRITNNPLKILYELKPIFLPASIIF